MAHIITLVPKTNDVDEAHARTIAFLEDALERARNEKATFALMLLLSPDNSVTTGWSAEARVQPFTVVGGLEDVKRRFMAKEIES